MVMPDTNVMGAQPEAQKRRRGAEVRTPENMVQPGTTWHGRAQSKTGHRATVTGAVYIDEEGQKRLVVKHDKGQTRRPLLASFLADFAIDPGQVAAAPPAQVVPATAATATERALLSVVDDLRAAGFTAWDIVNKFKVAGSTTDDLARFIERDLVSIVPSQFSEETRALLWPGASPETLDLAVEILRGVQGTLWDRVQSALRPVLLAARSVEEIAAALTVDLAESLPRAVRTKVAPYAHLLRLPTPATPSVVVAVQPLEEPAAPVLAPVETLGPARAPVAPVIVAAIEEGTPEAGMLRALTHLRNVELADEGISITSAGVLRKLILDAARARGVLVATA